MDSLTYFQERQCARQWRVFLHAFAEEFAPKGERADLRGFMHQLGRRMARQLPVREGESLEALQGAMNAVWSEIDWGWVVLEEAAESLAVRHHEAPLRQAFGVAALPWASALLEGVYAEWFESLGMDPSLRLTQQGDTDDAGATLVYQLKKQTSPPSYFSR